jgi:competence protein ComEC
MKFRYLLFLSLLLLASATPLGTEPAFRQLFVVWNIGQGQWATWVRGDVCHHFDMGGEKMPARKIKSLCRDRENRIYLSHWDWDHVGFAGKARRLFPRVCLALAPEGPSSPRKMNLLKGLPACPALPEEIRSLYRAEPSKNSNDLSHVLLVGGRILIPGDSTTKQEKIWDQVSGMGGVGLLLLGHHGSRTSTSEDLLRTLSSLKMAVASARFRKYGHPHAEVITRLRAHHVPLLRTEDWGNLWFETAVF